MALAGGYGKIIPTVALTAVVALVCAGCGSYRPSLPTDYHGVAVSAAPGPESPPATPAPPTKDGIQFPGSPPEDLARKMADSLAWQIGQWEPVSPDCADKLVFTGTTKTFDCAARWDDVSVPFEVTIGGDANPFFTLQAAQLKGLIVAAQVQQAWGRRYVKDAFAPASDGNALTCDNSIPRAVVVALNTPTPYRCAVAESVFYAKIAVDPFGQTGGYQVTFTSIPP